MNADELLCRALDWLRHHADHPFDCPRNRDDYDCTCGLSELKDDIEAHLDRPKEAA